MASPGTRSSDRTLWAVLAGVLVCLCAAFGAAVLGVGGIYLMRASLGSTGATPEAFNEPSVPIRRPSEDSGVESTLRALQTTSVRPQDPYEAACRRWNTCSIARTLHAPSKPYAVGDKRLFWVWHADTGKRVRVLTILRYITPHSYLWIEDDLLYREQDAASLMTTFEDSIYPATRRIFGSEWTPGVDNDPHIHVLYVRDLGVTTGGYFSLSDEFNPLVYPQSNTAELFAVDADDMPLASEDTYSAVAHEFQHMISWNLDPNEAAWLDQGLSELAPFMQGYDPGIGDRRFARRPDLSLIDWIELADDSAISIEHYGESFLFADYFLDRFGESAINRLSASRRHGLDSVDDVLRALDQADPLTGRVPTADDVVVDWMLATYLQDPAAGDGRYTYRNYPAAPRAAPALQIRSCPQASLTGSINQYGADFVEIQCPGKHVLEFTGSTVTPLLPADAHSGSYAFWSNIGDSTDMTLTRQFDLTGLTGSVILNYWTWYDIEPDVDSVDVTVSVDGKSWTRLKTRSCTEKNRYATANACEYSGRSGGAETARWIQDSVDLFSYAGKTIRVRFEYVSNSSDTGYGMLLDDFSLAGLNYAEDFESGHGGWQADGFVRLQNGLPQTYRLALIRTGPWARATVQHIALQADQTASIPFSLGPFERAVLLITGTQRYTRLPSGYAIEVK